VRRELLSLLDCGILARGFLRVRCPRCRKDLLVAFSCKGRGVCPSCSGRRMADTAAHLVDDVLPLAPVRQWVPSLPFDLRCAVAFDRQLCRAVRVGRRPGTVFVPQTGPECAADDGFSLHAGVCVPGGPRDRERLEQLCRLCGGPHKRHHADRGVMRTSQSLGHDER
jgi:hypothetical protein